MSILNRWRQFGKRYFWPHLLLGVVAASIGAPSILANADQQALSTTPTSVNRLNSSVQPISDNGLWQNVSRQSAQSVNPWHQQAIRRFLTRLAFAISPQNEDSFVSDEAPFSDLSVYDWTIVDSLTGLLTSNRIVVSYQLFASLIRHDHLVGQGAALWLVKQGGLRAGPFQYF